MLDLPINCLFEFWFLEGYVAFHMRFFRCINACDKKNSIYIDKKLNVKHKKKRSKNANILVSSTIFMTIIFVLKIYKPMSIFLVLTSLWICFFLLKKITLQMKNGCVWHVIFLLQLMNHCDSKHWFSTVLSSKKLGFETWLYLTSCLNIFFCKQNSWKKCYHNIFL